MLLNWRTVIPSNDPRFLVRGSELSNAIVPNTGHRFQICEIRTYDGTAGHDREYFIRDAETINDAQVKEGKRPEIVFRAKDENSAIEWCMSKINA